MIGVAGVTPGARMGVVAGMVSGGRIGASTGRALDATTAGRGPSAFLAAALCTLGRAAA